MRPFEYRRADEASVAAQLGQVPDSQFLAGGTTLLDLMKLDVMRPSQVVDINDLEANHGRIEADAEGLHLGALVRMSAAADHPVVREQYPAIAQSLQLAASPQLRNMATLGGNVLQWTRCNYFRNPSWSACNKRNPGSGCAAMDGVNRRHAILGVSDRCIAAYPGDFAVALVALDATVRVMAAGGVRTMRVEDLHREPGDTPQIETVLDPGDLILGFHVPGGAWTRRALYLKIRDRESYEFALVSAAVALDMSDGVVGSARVALGGVATKPWRAREAEESLSGRPLTEESASQCAEIAFRPAVTRGGNAFKAELGRRALVRALLRAAALEV